MNKARYRLVRSREYMMSQIADVGWFHATNLSVTNVTNHFISEPLLLRQEKNEETHTRLLIACSLFIAIVLHAVFSHSNKAGVSGIFSLGCLAMTAVIAPVVGTILLVLACYRQCVIALLKATCKRGTFAGLMKGSDAFWALEDGTSRSVINILALTDFSFIVEASNYGEEPLRTVQELIEDRLLTQPIPFPKLLCYRRQSYGYFYWERQPYINVDDHIRWMDLKEQPDGMIAETVLKNYVSALSNAPLPANHSSGWEILIGRHPVRLDGSDPLDDMESGGKDYSRYPVLFRVHHTLGDGVALVRLLLDALADPCTRTPSRTPSPVAEYAPFSLNVDRGLGSFSEKSSYLNVPAEKPTMRKSASYNFENWNSYEMKQITPSTSLGDCVRAACRKFINLIEETKQINNLQYQTQNLQNINILINDKPTEEILEMVGNNFITEIRTNDKKPVSRQDRKTFESLFTEENSKEETTFVTVLKQNFKKLANIFYHLAVLTMLPATVMNQVITRTNDLNALHGPKLSGYKVVGWYLEQDSVVEDQLLMAMIKRIRLRTGAHFSDVLLTALSCSFENFFKRFKEVPRDITVVIPARIGRPDDGEGNTKVASAVIQTKELKARVTKLYLDRNAKRNHSVLYENFKTNLDNKFSVALLTLPISSESSSSSKPGFFTKLQRVRKYTNVLRRSADYLVNYWILNVVATFFPIPCLRHMVKSTQNSLVVSNMPGPQNLAKLAGHIMHNIVFWVPNRETTGLGITILSYGGRLQLGIIADRALIPCSEDAQLIVDDIVKNIQRMDQISSAGC